MLTPRLKDDNWALHQIAERQDTGGSLLKGTVPIEGYTKMLGQQYLINKALDQALDKALPGCPRCAELITDDQRLSQYLLADLAHFGIDPASLQAEPGVARYIQHIQGHTDQPLHLLGLHYVRLGACNGNSFVARKVRKDFDLPETAGTRYLDPFGAEQRTNWMEFKDALDAMNFSPAEQEEIFEGTRTAYLHSINQHLPEFKSAEQLLAEHGKTLDKKAFDEGHSVHVKPAAFAAQAGAKTKS